jgi:hypothetical protein
MDGIERGGRLSFRNAHRTWRFVKVPTKLRHSA